MSIQGLHETAMRTTAEACCRRPPGAQAEEQYLERCTRCLDCICVCPARALTEDAEGYPRLADPRLCANCGLCADICMHGAIDFTERTRAGLLMVLAMERASDLF